MAHSMVQSIEVYFDLLESLEMPAECLKAAKELIESIEAEGYVGGLTPKVWGQYVYKSLGGGRPGKRTTNLWMDWAILV